MRTCLRAGGKVNSNHERITMSSVLTTRPWPVRQKLIGTSLTVSHIEYKSQSILSRNDSPLDCLHLLLAYRYYFAWRRHGNISPCTGSRVNSNYVWIASRVGTQFRTRVSESQRQFPPPTVMSHLTSFKKRGFRLMLLLPLLLAYVHGYVYIYYLLDIYTFQNNVNKISTFEQAVFMLFPFSYKQH